MKRFRGGLVFKAHRLLHHSTLGLRVIKKKKTCVTFQDDLPLVDQRFKGFRAFPGKECLDQVSSCRGTSLIRNRLPLGPWSSIGSSGALRGGAVSYERGTPVERSHSADHEYFRTPEIRV